MVGAGPPMSLYREPTCDLRGCIRDLIYSEEEGKYLPGFIVHDIVLVSLYSLWEDHFPQAHLSFMHQSLPIIHRTLHLHWRLPSVGAGGLVVGVLKAPRPPATGKLRSRCLLTIQMKTLKAHLLALKHPVCGTRTLQDVQQRCRNA